MYCSNWKWPAKSKTNVKKPDRGEFTEYKCVGCGVVLEDKPYIGPFGFPYCKDCIKEVSK